MSFTWKKSGPATPSRRLRKRRANRRNLSYRPLLEPLEDRELLSVEVWPTGNVNISRENDNQAEPTIAIDPTAQWNLFSASVTFHGTLPGTFNDNALARAPDPFDTFPSTTHAMFAAYSTNYGRQNTWVKRFMATGGPGGDSLPAGGVDPQATFDAYGNLFLTYLAPRLLQYGSCSIPNNNTLVDPTGRTWEENMWIGRRVTAFHPNPMENPPITLTIMSNLASQLTLQGTWPVNYINTPGVRYAINTIDVPGTTDNTSVVLVHSNNGGQSFQFVKFIDEGPLVDYPAIATGPGRPGMDEQSVWVAWRAANGNVLVSGTSVGGRGYGLITTPFIVEKQTVTGSLNRSLPRAQVGPDGQLMVSFHTMNTGMNPTQVFVNVDETGLNAGGFRVAANFVTDTNIVASGAGSARIPAQPLRGITPQVSLAWDRWGWFGPQGHGRVYLVYTHSPFGINHQNTDVFVRYSNNSGVNWSNPVDVLQVPDLSSQFLPSIAVDPQWGNVAVAWLDAGNDPQNTRVELHVAISEDGGNIFGYVTKIAAQSSNANLANKQQWGYATANSGLNDLTDANQNWIPNDYWRNYRAHHLAAAETPRIAQNNATVLTLQAAWFSQPVVGDYYQIEYTQPPGRPYYSFDYGEYTGLAYFDGTLYPIWADNSNSTGDNPNSGPAAGVNRALDLYTDEIWVFWYPNASSSPTGTTTLRLGSSVFTAVPTSRLLEAALLLVARRTFPTGAPTGAAFDQFVLHMYRATQKLADLAARSPGSTAAIFFGWPLRTAAPSLLAVDRFFRQAWADGMITAADLTIRLA